MRIVIIIGVLSAFVLGAFWAFTHVETRRSTVDSIEQGMTRDMALIRGDISVRLSSQATLVGAVSTFAERTHADEGPVWSNRTAAFIHSLAENRRDWRSLILVDRRGIITHGSRPDAPVVGLDASERDYFTAHLASPEDRIAISKPFRSRVDGNWIWVVSRAIRRADGTLLGVVAAAIDRRFFGTVFQGADIAEGFAFYLVHQDGTVLEASGAQFEKIGRPFPSSPSASAQSADPAFRTVDLWTPGEPVTMTAARVGDWPFFLVATYSPAFLDRVFAERSANLRSLGIVAVVTILVGTAGFAVVARRAERTIAMSQAETREADELLKAAMDACPVGIAIADAPDGRLRYVNEAGLQIRGGGTQTLVNGVVAEDYSAAWQIRDLDGRLLSPDEVPLARAIRTGEPSRRRFLIRRRADDDRIVDANAAPVVDSAGAVLSAVVVFSDVTEEQRRERALAETVAQLRLAQRIARIGNWSLDPAVGVPVWSDEVYRIYEWDPSLPPPPLAEYDTLYTGRDLDRFRAAITRAIRDGVSYEMVLRLTLPGRPSKWVRAIGEPDPEAGPAGHVVRGTIQDITKDKQLQDALARSAEKLRLAMEVAADGIWEYEVETGAVEWNARYFEMLGHAPGAFKETFEAWRDLVHPDDWPTIETAGMASIEQGVPFEAEYRMRRADGSWMWVWDHGRPVEWSDQGTVARLIGTLTDIDARKRRELAEVDARMTAEQATQAKSEFLATTSHELRTPLNAILGFSEMIKDEMLGSLGNERYRQYAADIHAAGVHLTDLVNSVLDLAKIEAGKRDLSFEPLDVGAVVAAVLHLVQHKAANAGLRLEQSVDPDLPVLMADSLAVRQIVFNLLSNAIKYTPRGGRVTITATPCGQGGVAISVADTGIGISPEDQARLFQPFTRTGEVERRHIEGTGLGLALVKSLMDLHGGTVSVESTAGEGSVFTVCFPARHA